MFRLSGDLLGPMEIGRLFPKIICPYFYWHIIFIGGGFGVGISWGVILTFDLLNSFALEIQWLAIVLAENSAEQWLDNLKWSTPSSCVCGSHFRATCSTPSIVLLLWWIGWVVRTCWGFPSGGYLRYCKLVFVIGIWFMRVCFVLVVVIWDIARYRHMKYNAWI